jgi:hypothetical protein
MLKKIMSGCVVLAAGCAIAGPPVENVGQRHPNIAAAQRLTTQAWERVVAAQQANEYDLGGHAQKAKEFLAQANRELKLAAETANQR